MMIDSLLDTDFYKLTMQQCVFHNFTDVKVEYTFKCRNLPSSIFLPYKELLQGKTLPLMSDLINPEIFLKPACMYFLPGRPFLLLGPRIGGAGFIR